MSIIDQIIGRLKKAVGDVTEDAELRREGVLDERAGRAKEELSESEKELERKAAEVADLERRRQ